MNNLFQSDAYGNLQPHRDITERKHQGDECSAAANPTTDQKRRDHGKILDAVRQAPDGLTTQEVTKKTGLSYQTASARVSELVKAGRLVRKGRRDTDSGNTAHIHFVKGGE